MGAIEGSRSVEIDATVQECYDVAADIEGAPVWQGSLREVEVLERDTEGRPELVQTVNDAKVKSVKTLLRFSYDPPGAMGWEQVKGDMKSLVGGWRFDDLGDGRTRATYELHGDPGRMLGMLIRGPVEGQVREFLVGGAAEGLKAHLERA
jgi:uncharacterized membrane protein